MTATETAPEFTIEQTDRARYRLAIPMTRNESWEQWVLLMSDDHHDNPHCRRDLLKEDLDEAVKRNAIIFQGGDLFCAMQGWGDPRSGKGDIRPEDCNGKYLDNLVNHAATFYGPYARNYAFIARGNHELSVLKRKETDLTERLVGRLNGEHGGRMESLPVASHIAIRWDDGNSHTYSTKLYLHHGYGGGGPVTKGAIQTNRQAVYLNDADIVWNGHIHESWVMPIKRDGTTAQGKAYSCYQWHVRTPTYKDEYQGGGWHDLRGGPPKPLGSMWARFYLKRGRDRIQVDFTQNLR